MRRRILALVAGAVVIVVLAFAIPIAVLVRRAVYDDATAALREEANHVANYLRGYRSSPTRAELATYLAGLTSGCSASVQLANGTVVGTPPPGSPADLPALTSPGGGGPGSPGGPGGDPDHGPIQPTMVRFHNGELVQLQVLEAGPTGSAVVRVYADDGQLHSGETGWWLLLAGVSVGLLLIGVGAAELLTRRLVRPLELTVATANRMSAGDVTARAPTSGPREIADVGAALNRLGGRIDELLLEERETVADLSHRLRTPLTALRLDAEALRDRAESERIGEHVSRLERALTAVIQAARRPQREGRLPSCDATAVVAARVAFWSALAEDQSRSVTVELPEQALLVRASGEDLATAVDALLENVLAHTPEGTAFRVRLRADETADEGGPAGTDAAARLEVEDDGPGIADDALERGRSDRGSSGLGLDIARRCAQASGGSLTIGALASGGALVVLRLGAA